MESQTTMTPTIFPACFQGDNLISVLSINRNDGISALELWSEQRGYRCSGGLSSRQAARLTTS